MEVFMQAADKKTVRNPISLASLLHRLSPNSRLPPTERGDLTELE